MPAQHSLSFSLQSRVRLLRRTLHRRYHGIVTSAVKRADSAPSNPQPAETPHRRRQARLHSTNAHARHDLHRRRRHGEARRRYLSTGDSDPPRTNPTTLLFEDATVHLLGTMHIARASATAARRLIKTEHEKGTLGNVFLELDEQRYTRLVAAHDKGHHDADNGRTSFLDGLSDLLRTGRLPGLGDVLGFAVSALYRALHAVGFAGGMEFTVAARTARSLHVPITLGDRDARVTMEEVAAGLRADLSPVRLLALLARAGERGRGRGAAAGDDAESDVERNARKAVEMMLRGDVEGGQERLGRLVEHGHVRELVTPLREFAPTAARALLDVRDVHMARRLADVVRDLPRGKRTVVAVVGLAHVDGIAREWERVTVGTRAR